MGKWALAWVPMVLIAVANGILRQAGYGRWVGELAAHQISTAIGIFLFGVYIWFVIRKWRPHSSGQALRIGLLWLALTVFFEFSFMHYAAGVPWSRLLQDYDVSTGRVWVFLLLWVTLAPYLFYRRRHERPRR